LLPGCIELSYALENKDHEIDSNEYTTGYQVLTQSVPSLIACKLVHYASQYIFNECFPSGPAGFGVVYGGLECGSHRYIPKMPNICVPVVEVDAFIEMEEATKNDWTLICHPISPRNAEYERVKKRAQSYGECVGQARQSGGEAAAEIIDGDDYEGVELHDW
jgi:hypothetical protein